MDVDSHGGECCGIQHIHGFPLGTGWSAELKKQQVDAAVGQALEGYWDCDCDDECNCYTKHMKTWTLLCEVVLVDSQLPEWEDAVRAAGFKRVSRFKNSNSGNFCNVFHFVTNKKRVRRKAA